MKLLREQASQAQQAKNQNFQLKMVTERVTELEKEAEVASGKETKYLDKINSLLEKNKAWSEKCQKVYKDVRS